MKRRTVAGLVAGAAAIALVAGISIAWPGLDAQETAKVDTSVWALQTGDGGRYARVNTSIGELDTVRDVSNPSEVVQSSEGAYIFSDGFSALTSIDAAFPADLDESALDGAPPTPPGTVDVVTAGDFVAYRTDTGAVFAGRLSDADPAQLDPGGADDDAPQYSADAIAIDARGMLFSYSRADGAVLRYDVPAGEVRGRDPIIAAGLTAPAITAAGERWVLVDVDDGEVWLDGADAAAAAPVTGAIVLSVPDPDGRSVYLADDTGLVRVDVEDGAMSLELPAADSARGTPARPIVHDGQVYAAWLPQGEGQGSLWESGGTGAQPLDYAGEALPDQRRPAFVVSGDSIILNETRSGWVWTIPDGDLVESSQNWSLDEDTDPNAEQSDDELAVVIDPRPPVAEADAFGVRAAGLATLPVLMNDHDPNEDVLSIDPASVTALDPSFGALSITDDGQRFTVRVAAGATGSASFAYAVTDGTAETGLLSPPTTVTLTVADDGVGAAPEWCGVAGCLVPWPQPEVARGGTVTVPVLPGWVDPEGDPLLLLSVQNTTGVGSVAATPSGDVIYQHSESTASGAPPTADATADPAATGDQLVDLTVTVADTTGQQTTKQLVVKVAAEPELAVQSFAVVDTIDAGLTVDVTPHVTGTAGMISLESVRVLDDAAATATIVGASASFDFAAQTPGTYRVGFTATDGDRDAAGTARITILPGDAPPQLATSPVVAFVHPQQDATLDVFAAVSNPTRRVLLLSDVVANPEPGATLSVDAVGQNNLRVSGTTASGATGRLGTVSYTVSDGTDDQGARVQGEATVFLLPPAPELAPIAVDDTVVVRAGAQVDIPILENDIAPAGGRPTLNPASIVSSSPEALAFAGTDVLRYLAPATPGEYTVDYGIFTTGAPALADDATVQISVLADDANRAPIPETIEGRVLSGGSTLLEFDDFGTDPDGDVVTLDRIVSQPENGTATISADGESIVYSSVAGDRGQVAFRYRVVDEFGATGEGSVRIGVLDGQSNPSPITFTDYVQVQAGPQNTIRVNPLTNDVDPTRGSLTITDVRPDLPETLVDGSANPEYERLAASLLSAGDSTIVLAAGTEPATMSFLYDVESSSGNTGRGLVVVRVVRESVPDYPVVADTILTAETRADFADGVDVLTGRTSWAAGEVDDLEVSLWGSPDDVLVQGGRLRGPLPSESRVIPFAVSGEVTDAAGQATTVTTYAFLRVPGENDLSLTLRSTLQAPEVDELQSVAFDMDRLVVKPRGSVLEVDAVQPSGARPNATCTVESGTVIRYTAGAGAPWTDACRVPVRVSGQADWTYLSVPVVIRPLDPQPELRAGSVTVGPGETATFDLRNMTSWQTREDWSGIAYALDYAGSAFDVSLDGSIVTITGGDSAVPATEEAALVSVPSHAGAAPARLILRVGAAPSTLPQGGAVTQQCSQAAGSSCTITVIGAPGEVNPLPRSGLTVVAVRPVAACVGVDFSIAGPTSVQATWADDAPGATCAATFSVLDAQGRISHAERDGRILLDLQGYPRAPAGIVQTGYSDGQLTLRVDPGDARTAYPELTGFVIRSGGTDVAQCGVDGTCSTITAPNGEQRTYEAFAVNAVGFSRGSVSTVAWAYDPPPAPQSAESRPVVTDGEGGIVSLTIEGIDPAQAGGVDISSPTGESIRVSLGRTQTRLEVPSYRVGANTATPITITAFSRIEPPAGLDGTQSGSALTITGNGIGAPRDAQLALTTASDGNGTSTVTGRGSAVTGGDGSALRFGIVRDGERCRPAEGGEVATFAGLQDGEEYGFILCVVSVFDGQVFGTTTTTASVRVVQNVPAPAGYTFLVDAAPTVGDTRAEWVIRTDPVSAEPLPYRNRAEFAGLPSTVFDRAPGVQVRYVHTEWGTATDWVEVTPRAGSAPYQVQASWTATACVGGQELTTQGDSSRDAGGQGAEFTFDNAGLQYFDAAGAPLAHTPGTWTVPAGATRVEGIGVTADWARQGWGLSPASSTFTATCDPGPPVPAPPTP